MIDATGMPQTAVVLGATSDIAGAVLRELAAHRLRHVVLAGRDLAGLEAVARELAALGVTTAETIVWDATTGPHADLAAEASARLGQIDLVFVAVGMLGDQAVCESDPEAMALMVDTNFGGPAAAMVAFSELLRSQGQGRLVVLSSVAGVRVRRDNFAYGAAKAGLDTFAQGLSEALRGDGVGVMIVRPGWVATRMTTGLTPAPFATTADRVAADVVRGLEQGAPVVWSPPPLRLVFGFIKFLPQWAWRQFMRVSTQ